LNEVFDWGEQAQGEWYFPEMPRSVSGLGHKHTCNRQNEPVEHLDLRQICLASPGEYDGAQIVDVGCHNVDIVIAEPAGDSHRTAD
jgi:hypothetical protein